MSAKDYACPNCRGVDFTPVLTLSLLDNLFTPGDSQPARFKCANCGHGVRVTDRDTIETDPDAGKKVRT